MAFFPIAPSTDNRSARGAVPLVLRNVYLETQPEGSGKPANFYLAPTPGMTSRVTPSSGNLLRGYFCRPGVVGGLLFAVFGTTLYSVTTSWVSTAIGSVGGSGRVLFDSVGANLYILSSGALYKYDGSSLTGNSDPDFPSNAFNLVSLADRAITNEENSDTFDWSAVGDGLDWPATGFASSARLPDPILSQIVLGGDLWHFGKNSTQVWRAVGGVDSDAFDLLSSLTIDRGIIGRDAIAKLDSYAMWVGEDRVVYELNGYQPARVPNRDLEIALAELGEPEISAVRCFAYANGSHLTWIVRLPTGRAWAFDVLTRRWHERACLGQTTFALTHYARFEGKHVVGSDTSDRIFTWDDGVYSDNGEVIERVMMLHVPVSGRTPISNITLDMKTFGQPLSGQGSDPKCMLTFYRDGGSLDSLATKGIERQLSMGRAGKYNVRPTCWRLGMFNTVDGLLLKIRITDPVGFALNGVYVNEIVT